jgi:hypothetical protein
VSYSVTRTQLHSIIPSGAFQLQLSSAGNEYSTAIAFDSSADEFRNAIQKLSSDFTVSSLHLQLMFRFKIAHHTG